MILSIDTEKSFDKIQHPLAIKKKNLIILRIERNFLNPIKDIKNPSDAITWSVNKCFSYARMFTPTTLILYCFWKI